MRDKDFVSNRKKRKPKLYVLVPMKEEAPTCVPVIAHRDTQAVFEALCDYTQKQPHPPSLHQLAKACRLSRRSLSRHLKQLQREGYRHRELIAPSYLLPANTQAIGEAILNFHEKEGHPPTLQELAITCHLSVLTIRHHLGVLRQGMTAERLRVQQQMEKVYTFLKAFIQQKGFAPTFREIMAGCDIKSTSSVQDYLLKLEQRGCIVRSSHHARALQIVD